MRGRGGSFVDPRLKQRVEQYLTSNKCGQYVDIGILATDLQRRYSTEYGRRKRNAFRIQVEKVFTVISSERECKNLTALEDEHRAKRARHRQGEDEDSEICTDDSDIDPEYPVSLSSPTNHMNNSLVSLYRKGNPDTLPSATKDQLTETSASTQIVVPRTSTPPQQTRLNTRISEGGWFIDKAPGRKEEDFFIDLSEGVGEKTKLNSENSKDLSLLETERKKTKDKRGKRRKEESRDVDEEIESALRKQKRKSCSLQGDFKCMWVVEPRLILHF
uniref:NVL2 nucleolin binding domain-containing protein n=1 Tax=Sphenodon punctatus TaxID=8508 RepID=A0A8D0HAT0_SPHPU